MEKRSSFPSRLALSAAGCLSFTCKWRFGQRTVNHGLPQKDNVVAACPADGKGDVQTPTVWQVRYFSAFGAPTRETTSLHFLFSRATSSLRLTSNGVPSSTA